MQSALHGNVTGYQAETADLSAFPLPYSVLCISPSSPPSLLFSRKLEIETHMELEERFKAQECL